MTVSTNQSSRVVTLPWAIHLLLESLCGALPLLKAICETDHHNQKWIQILPSFYLVPGNYNAVNWFWLIKGLTFRPCCQERRSGALKNAELEWAGEKTGKRRAERSWSVWHRLSTPSPFPSLTLGLWNEQELPGIFEIIDVIHQVWSNVLMW